MKNPVDSFAAALRAARAKRHLTQRALADNLHMSVRTIIEIELGRSNPRFETVALLAEELNISLDAIVFPDTATATVSKTVTDFFAGKSEAEIQSTFPSASRQMHLRLTSKRRLFGIIRQPPFPCDISPVILFTGGYTWCRLGCWSGLFVVHRGFSNPRERAAAGLCPSPPILIRLSYWVILRIFFFCCTLRCRLHQGQKQAAGRSKGTYYGYLPFRVCFRLPEFPLPDEHIRKPYILRV